MYKLIKYSVLIVGIALITSFLLSTRTVEEKIEVPFTTIESDSQVKTEEEDSMPASKEYLIHTAYLMNP